MRNNTVRIISSIPAAGFSPTGAGLEAKAFPKFIGEVDAASLAATLQAFGTQLSTVLDGLGTVAGGKFEADVIEVSAVLSADGKIGLLGSSVGGGIEGAMKVVWKRARPS